jgi:thiamine biosynthesis protein ThiI
MFQPNCVIVHPSPEIAIKGNQVRAFMQKRLKKNMGLYFKHAKVPFTKMISSAGRIFIYSTEPTKGAYAIRECFGIHSLYLAREEEYSSLKALCKKGAELSSRYLTRGTFAARGKSFSNEFSSKELEEEMGGALLDAYPELKVKLKSPEKEIHCVAFKDRAYIYFKAEECAGGMPASVQGYSGLIVSDGVKGSDLALLAKDLLKTGCSVILVGEKTPEELAEIEKFNCYNPFKRFFVEEAKKLYDLHDLRGFFSAARDEAQAKKDSDFVGVKAFAPLLF